MGHNDHLPALYEEAKDILETAGAIKECRECEFEMVRCGDPDAESQAYAIGTKRVQNGQIKADRKELMDAIYDVLNDTAEHCIRCHRCEHRDG